MADDLVRLALAYARAGFPVFPCRPNADPCPASEGERCECKAPLTAHGFQDSTTDAAMIRAWWERWPDANVAIATGAPGPDVLDVDVKPSGTGWEAFNRLKRSGLLAGAAASIRTPSGGLHVYYVGTGQGCGSLPKHHLDFKATGGYVLAPPSRVHGRPYELLDHRAAGGCIDWRAARELLDPPRPLPAGRPGRDASAGALAAWVAKLAEGNRNAGLYWAACRVADDPQALEQLAAAAVQAGLSEAEARRTVASAARRGER